jgi:aspartate aminotransferase
MSSHTNLYYPEYAVLEKNLVPVSGYLSALSPIPPSRMFLINKSLRVYQEKNPSSMVFDASQGDGGASLPACPGRCLRELLRCNSHTEPPMICLMVRMLIDGASWKPTGKQIQTWDFRPANIAATAGGRDALIKAYQAMLTLGHGREGDVIIVSRVPWISYNWGPYGIGANVLWAPGDENEGWAYTEDSIKECVEFANRSGRKVAGLVITCPDNPTGLTISTDRQALLAKTALKSGVGFVLFDWMYHYVTDERPMDLNQFLRQFERSERPRLMFLDGITKSLGASNIRNCHLIASEEVIKFIVARASHGVIPSFFSLAVAMAAYEMGYKKAASSIIEPTNESRKVLKRFMDENKLKYILGKGYYAFIHVGEALTAKGWESSEPLGQYLAEEFGVAIVPGAFFSPHGNDWIRFSYATPP